MSSLDDFFAKKDRKKSTTKTNLLAADELYRTLEETTKAPQEVDSAEKLHVEVANNQQPHHAALEFGIRFSDETIDEEDEWCDFTEEHDQPFPNLKRNSKLVLGTSAVATISEDANLTVENCTYKDTGGDGLDVGPASDELGKPACPWLKLEPTELTNFSMESAVEQKASPPIARSQLHSQSQSQSQIQAQPQSQSQSQSQSQLPSQSSLQPQSQSQSQSVSQTAFKAQPNNVVPKKQVYVPPALRQSQSEFSVRPRKQAPTMAMKLAKGQAPDLNNVDFFPSLCQSRISKRAK